MGSRKDIFHQEFKSRPFWWEAFNPASYPKKDLPTTTAVAIIGGGYTGLSAALELGKQGVECCVVDSGNPGYHASTRSGGIVAGPGGVKAPLVTSLPTDRHFDEMVVAANEGLQLVESIIQEEKIDCQWCPTGFLKLACTRKHLVGMKRKLTIGSRPAGIHSRILDEVSIRHGIGSHYYHGGLLTDPGGHLHPALYFGGLLGAVERRRQVIICAHAKVNKIQENRSGWQLQTSRGPLWANHVIVATNGYTTGVTPQFSRRVIPIRAYIIATEILDEETADALSPGNHGFAESTRIAPFFRLSGPVGSRRLIFGSRVKWVDIEPDEMAPFLFDLMIKRFPPLRETKITHAWTGNVALTLDEELHNGRLDGLYYALGCNGSGVANMTYLGTQVARKIISSRLYSSPFDGVFPQSRFYNGDQRWFIPVIGRYLMARDWLDMKLDDRSPETKGT